MRPEISKTLLVRSLQSKIGMFFTDYVINRLTKYYLSGTDLQQCLQEPLGLLREPKNVIILTASVAGSLLSMKTLLSSAKQGTSFQQLPGAHWIWGHSHCLEESESEGRWW